MNYVLTSLVKQKWNSLEATNFASREAPGVLQSTPTCIKDDRPLISKIVFHYCAKLCCTRHNRPSRRRASFVFCSKHRNLCPCCLPWYISNAGLYTNDNIKSTTADRPPPEQNRQMMSVTCLYHVYIIGALVLSWRLGYLYYICKMNNLFFCLSNA